MFSLEKIIQDLQDGYVLSFEYMNKEHQIMSFDKDHYVVKKYTYDNLNKREEKMIVPIKVLKEMFKDMKDISYVY